MAGLAVLVVDDAGFIRDMVKKSIRRQFNNVDVDLAPNGKKAQKLLRERKYDLILCDWEMPELDGGQLLQWVREQEDFGKTPFIMVTSRGEKKFVLKAAEAGVNGYLTKPFTNEQLVHTVTKSFRRNGKLQQAIGQRISESAIKSITALTGKPPATQPETTPQPDETPRSVLSHPSSAGTGINESRKTAQLRFGDQVQSCVIRELTLEEIQAFIRPDDQVPKILEQAVVHLLDSHGSETVQLNGYVQSLIAVEKKMVNIIVRFVDHDQQKKMSLSHYITLM